MLQKLHLLLLFLFIQNTVLSINCSNTISGKIMDKHDNTTLNLATIFIIENNKNYIADENGKYNIENICEGNYTFIIYHLGCQPDTQKIIIKNNIVQNFYLEHHEEALQEIITIANNNKPKQSIAEETITKQQIQKNGNKSITEIIKMANGINILQTGSNISKPIIHGLYNDRILTIVNGFKLVSQDWGTEHALEIDPFLASKIEVIKGVAGLEFATNAIGGVIKIESENLSLNKKIVGSIHQSYQTNGKGITTSLNIGQGFKDKFAYKTIFTFKKQGDNFAPKYSLTNTGGTEINMANFFKWKIQKWNTKLNYTLFNEKLGILRAAHIGNLTDLQNAIASDTPLIVLPFTYQINNPKQTISHHSIIINNSYSINEKLYYYLDVNSQFNHRKEYDIRRGGRSDIAALDMKLNTINVATYLHQTHTFKNVQLDTKYGFNFTNTTNTNNAATGVRPLIPDYAENKLAVFNTNQIQYNNFTFDAGFRLEYDYLKVLKFNSQNILIEPNFNFYNYGISIGALYNKLYNYKHQISISSNIGFATKNPNINELFSEGLHHAAAVIEYGNSNLKTEKSIKWISNISYDYLKYLQTDITFYINKINNYIYSSPLLEPVLTIRGAFPAFQYKPTNARLVGIDLMAKTTPLNWLEIAIKSSIIRSKDITNNDYLIYIPSDNFSTTYTLKYDINKKQQLQLSNNVETIFKQKRIPTKIIDYKNAPNTYTLWNANFDYTINLQQKKQNELKFSLECTNILNKSYRNYLDKFRYYADASGRNVTLKFLYNFY